MFDGHGNWFYCSKDIWLTCGINNEPFSCVNSKKCVNDDGDTKP